MRWFSRKKNKENLSEENSKIVKKIDKGKRCNWCGNKLKNKEEYREPDNTHTILCKNCFDRALDNLVRYGATRTSDDELFDKLNYSSNLNVLELAKKRRQFEEQRNAEREYRKIDEKVERKQNNLLDKNDVEKEKQVIKKYKKKKYLSQKKGTPDYKDLSDGEVSKKKFNAYLNPGTDEAEFRRSYKTRYGAHDKTEYDKGRDRVKRILDKKEKDDK